MKVSDRIVMMLLCAQNEDGKQASEPSVVNTEMAGLKNKHFTRFAVMVFRAITK